MGRDGEAASTIEGELAQALTAAINAGRFELANRILLELEKRREVAPSAPAGVLDLAEERSRRRS